VLLVIEEQRFYFFPLWKRQLFYFLIRNESGDRQTTLYDIHKIAAR